MVAQPTSFVNPRLDGPDEPDHPRHCPGCQGFLRHAGWTYELLDDERRVAWYTHCAKCGSMVVQKCR